MPTRLIRMVTILLIPCLLTASVTVHALDEAISAPFAKPGHSLGPSLLFNEQALVPAILRVPSFQPIAARKQKKREVEAARQDPDAYVAAEPKDQSRRGPWGPLLSGSHSLWGLGFIAATSAVLAVVSTALNLDASHWAQASTVFSSFLAVPGMVNVSGIPSGESDDEKALRGYWGQIQHDAFIYLSSTRSNVESLNDNGTALWARHLEPWLPGFRQELVGLSGLLMGIRSTDLGDQSPALERLGEKIQAVGAVLQDLTVRVHRIFGPSSAESTHWAGIMESYNGFLSVLNPLREPFAMFRTRAQIDHITRRLGSSLEDFSKSFPTSARRRTVASQAGPTEYEIFIALSHLSRHYLGFPISHLARFRLLKPEEFLGGITESDEFLEVFIRIFRSLAPGGDPADLRNEINSWKPGTPVYDESAIKTLNGMIKYPESFAEYRQFIGETADRVAALKADLANIKASLEAPPAPSKPSPSKRSA